MARSPAGSQGGSPSPALSSPQTAKDPGTELPLLGLILSRRWGSQEQAVTPPALGCLRWRLAIWGHVPNWKGDHEVSVGRGDQVRVRFVEAAVCQALGGCGGCGQAWKQGVASGGLAGAGPPAEGEGPGKQPGQTQRVAVLPGVWSALSAQEPSRGLSRGVTPPPGRRADVLLTSGSSCPWMRWGAQRSGHDGHRPRGAVGMQQTPEPRGAGAPPLWPREELGLPLQRPQDACPVRSGRWAGGEGSHPSAREGGRQRGAHAASRGARAGRGPLVGPPPGQGQGATVPSRQVGQ